MQRSALPKSRAEKGKAASATPAVAHEIIPGKYTDQDWLVTFTVSDYVFTYYLVKHMKVSLLLFYYYDFN